MKSVKQIGILFTVAALLGSLGYAQASFGYTDNFSVNTTGNYETFQLNYGSVIASVQTQYDSANQKVILNTVGGYNYGFMKTKENSLIAAGMDFDFSVDFETISEFTTSIYLGDMNPLSSSNFIELRADGFAQQLYVNCHEENQGQISFRTPYYSMSGNIRMKRENGNYSFYYNGQLFASTRFDQFKDLSFYYAVVNYTSSGPSSNLTATSRIDNWNFVSEPVQPEWSFVQMADPQLEPPTDLFLPLGMPTTKDWFCATIYQINKCSPIPDFILISGDIVDYAKWRIWIPNPIPFLPDIPLDINAIWNYSAFSGVLDKLKPELKNKVYIVPGNHDGYLYDELDFSESGLDIFSEYIGHWYDFKSHYRPEDANDMGGVDYKFQYKDFLFVGLDSEENGLAQSQIDSLNSLSGLEKNVPKIIFMHHPPVQDNNGPILGWGENFVNYCKPENNNKVQLVLVGHEHRNEILNSKAEDVPANTDNYPQFVQTPSAGYAWYYLMPQDLPGFRIVNVKNNKSYPQVYTKTSFPKAIITSLFSPANVHVYDSNGNHVGITDNNSVDGNIPNSFYFSHQVLPGKLGIVSPEKIIIFDPCDAYLYKVIGKEKGNYRLGITSFDDGNNIVFEANGIPTSPGEIHDYIIDWNILAQGGDGVTIGIDINGDGVYERTITSDSNLTAAEFDQEPIAEAGPDQTVYAWIDGMADVNLDGSGSYDADGDTLTYKWSWTIDGNAYDANGVRPTIELPVGQHVISLIVNDGIVDSEPNEVVITVVPPVEANLCVMPKTLNCKSFMPKIMTTLRLPKGITKDQIDTSKPILLYPGEIEADKIWISKDFDFRCRAWNTTIFASFDKDELMDAIPNNGQVELVVVGQLKTGQYFYGTDDVRIICPGNWPWHKPWCDYKWNRWCKRPFNFRH